MVIILQTQGLPNQAESMLFILLNRGKAGLNIKYKLA